MDLSVIIVNYNGARWLEACLESLVAQANDLSYEIIVVDNASQDDSVVLLRRQFPWIRLVKNLENVGFAQANNQGIALARGRYVLLINNDTVFQSGLADLIAFLDQHPECAAVGPQMLDGNGHPRGSWGYFPTLGRLTATMLMLDRLPLIGSLLHPLLVRPSRSEFHRPAHTVDWASGACLLIRRAALEHIGGLDSHYFMYGEDVEWCYRAWRAGYQVCILPRAKLIHYGAGGKEWRDWKGPLATLNAYKHFVYFHQKHFPLWRMPLLRLVLACGAVLRLLGGLLLYLCRGIHATDRRIACQVIATYAEVLKFVAGVSDTKHTSYEKAMSGTV